MAGIPPEHGPVQNPVYPGKNTCLSVAPSMHSGVILLRSRWPPFRIRVARSHATALEAIGECVATVLPKNTAWLHIVAGVYNPGNIGLSTS